MDTPKKAVSETLQDIQLFIYELLKYVFSFFKILIINFEKAKSYFVKRLYTQRGKMAKRFTHSGMAGITALGVIVAPMLVRELESKGVNPYETISPPSVLSASVEDASMITDFSDKQFRDSIIDYTVADGDTVSSIAKKFGVSIDTIRWQNNLKTVDSIKLGQTLEILPITGVSHKVQKGDTIYGIAKQYDADPQSIADFPFNTFVNDETFELAIGQIVIVPEGVKKDDITPGTVPRVRQVTPDAGTVVASGQFAWPTHGTITQKFYWYHPGIDVANNASPDVLAADSGKVIFSGWDNTGYGNMVLIDHGNGYKTRYGHMQRLYVVVGQTVKRGAALGKMGSTGHSTGTHLHFEIYKGATRINPLSVLR